MKNIKFILLALFVATAVNSCQNEEMTAEDNTLLTEQETIAEEILSDLDLLVDEALDLVLFPEICHCGRNLVLRGLSDNYLQQNCDSQGFNH